MSLAVFLLGLCLAELGIAAPRPHPKSAQIDLTGCGKTKACALYPPACHPDECIYMYTHQMDGDMVNFQMFGDAAGWIAVGFNDAKRMSGTDVLACQLTPDHQKVVVKNLHNVNHTNQLDQPGNASPFISNAKTSFSDGKIMCSFSRPLKTSDPEHDRDLTQRHFFIFALSANGTAAPDAALTYPHTVSPVPTYGVYSAADHFFLGNTHVPIDLSTCGTAKGCSRYPEGCVSADECKYVYTQQQLPGNMVGFEISGMLQGWVAVGFNDIQGMNGTDVMACQVSAKESGGRVFVKNLHNVNFSNVMDDPDLVDPYIVGPEGYIIGSHIGCFFSRPFVTLSPQFDVDLTKPHYMIFTGNSNGTAPSNTALQHKHNFEPVVTPQMHTGLELFNFNGTAKAREETHREHHRAQPHWRH